MRSNDQSSDSRSAQRTAPVRVMRWVFTRGDDRLTCELALADDHACYEFRTIGRDAAPSIERYKDVGAAFNRQSAIERELVTSGWSLDSYESVLERRAAGAA